MLSCLDLLKETEILFKSYSKQMYDEIKHAYTSLDGISLSAPTTTTISKRESKQRLSRSKSLSREIWAVTFIESIK